MTNEQLVEQIARKLATHEGYDPDETWEEFDRNAAATDMMVGGVSEDEIFPKYVRWEDYEPQARAILPIILAAREEGARAMQDKAVWALRNIAQACGNNGNTETEAATNQMASVIEMFDAAKIAGGSDAESD